MKKKSVHPRHRSKIIHTHKIFVITLSLLLILVLASKSPSQKNILGILGTSITSGLLADKGSGDSGGGHDGGGGGSGGHDSGSSGSSGGGGSSSGGGDHSGDSGSSGGRSGDSDSKSGGSSGGGSAGAVNDNTTVACIGPDGKQFQTDFKHCSDFNNAWHASVNFTIVATPVPHQETPHIEKETPHVQTENEHALEPSHTPKPTITAKTDKNGEHENIEFKVKDGHNAADIKHEDETEDELETNDALEKANKALKETEVEVHASASGFVIHKGEVEAETHLPISVNPATHELNVTTNIGTNTVTILPDEAVRNTLNNGTFSDVQTHTNIIRGKPTTSSVIELTELNSEPAFKVLGETHKKFIGVVPVIFPKTAFVSAKTGAVLRIDETILNRIFELLSF